MGDQLRFVDDSGDTRLAGELVDDGATVGDVLTVQSDGSLAAAANGGSSSVVVRGPFSFAFDTPGLANGVSFYTPTPGDILLDAFIIVDEAFDGTNPIGDIGLFLDSNFGFFSDAGTDCFLASAATQSYLGAGMLNYASGNAPLSNANTLQGAATPIGVLPAIFVGSNPLLFVATQGGDRGATPIDSTQGAGRVFLVTATPVSF